MSNARSAASGLENTYVELRNTAGRADPTDKVGSNPRVRIFVVGLSSFALRSISSGITHLFASSRETSTRAVRAAAIHSNGLPRKAAVPPAQAWLGEGRSHGRTPGRTRQSTGPSVRKHRGHGSVTRSLNK